MIAEAAITAGGVWALRRLAHHAILRGLRAPRLRHSQGTGEQDFAVDRVCEVRIPGPRGRQLFGWLVSPPVTVQRPAPAVLAMHGWGANASMMWPVVPPLHTAGFAVLLIDARCHGRSDDEAFTSMPRFAEDIAAGLAWLRLQPDIAADRLALLGHSVGAAAALLHASRHHDDVRAVVSLSAFAHPREVMRRFLAEKHVPYAGLGWYVMRHVEHVKVQRSTRSRHCPPSPECTAPCCWCTDAATASHRLPTHSGCTPPPHWRRCCRWRRATICVRR